MNDSSGNGHNAITSSVIDYSNDDGISGYYGIFNNDYVEIDDSGLEPENITLEASVRSSGSPGTYRYIVGKRYSGGFGSYALYTGSTGGLYFYIGTSGGYRLSPKALSVDIWDGYWHHVTGTFDGTNIRLFIDNTEVTGTSTTMNDIIYNDLNFYIGGYGPGYYFNGKIDDVRIWDVALIGTDINLSDSDVYNLLYDTDGDGVLNDVDECLTGTFKDDPWDVSWGTNRWQVMDNQGTLGWYQNKPKGVSGQLHNMAYTYGCSGHQILQMIKNTYGAVMNGHWKYGLSSSVLDEFHWDLGDGVMDGQYLIETVVVPANNSAGINSVTSYVAGDNLLIKSRGVYYWTGGWAADTEYQNRPTAGPWGPAGWISGDLTPDPWKDGLDLVINSMGYDWVGNYLGPSASNEYTLNYTVASNGELNFKILDDAYGDNSGSLTVDIYATP